ncbi:MAG: NAD(P)H-binding protein [Myxococcota bacterium]
MPKRVLIAGATGYIGRHVVGEFVARGHSVIAMSRTPSTSVDQELEMALDGAHIASARVTDRTEIEAVLFQHQPEVVVSCLASRSGEGSDAWMIDYQANSNLLKSAQRNGATQFILLSAICVQKPVLEFQYAKLKFEAELIKSGLSYSVVRPTAFFKSLSGQIARVKRGKPYLLLGDGRRTACKPISQPDLARFITNCVNDRDKRNAILPVGGPGPAITPREQGEMLFSLLDRPPRFRSLPLWMMDAIVRGLSGVGWASPQLRTKAELARIGRYYATESMLVWNQIDARYDPDATPSFGHDTLWDHYRRALIDSDWRSELGDHSVFS